MDRRQVVVVNVLTQNGDAKTIPLTSERKKLSAADQTDQWDDRQIRA